MFKVSVVSVKRKVLIMMNLTHFIVFFVRNCCKIKFALGNVHINFNVLYDVVDGITFVLSEDGFTFIIESVFLNVIPAGFEVEICNAWMYM
jgi:hypothetical protein